MIISNGIPNPSKLTHLHLMKSDRDLVNMTSLLYLHMENVVHDLVLPSNLQIFVGGNITKCVTLPTSLTILELVGLLPKRIIGLDKHPNLKILRLKSTLDAKDLSNFDMPPTLVELEMRELPMKKLPNTLRILRLKAPYHDKMHLPDSIEELDMLESPQQLLRKLPSNLRILSLLRFTNIPFEQLQNCTTLTKIVIRGRYFSDKTTRDNLEIVEQFIPQITDFSFCSNQPNKALKVFQFMINLRCLRINFGPMLEEESVELGHLVKLRDLEIVCNVAQGPFCKIGLPLCLQRLRLLRTKSNLFANRTSRFSLTLPPSLKVLSVPRISRHMFEIGISREHLARLEIVGDCGKGEHNGHIETGWGQFVISD